MSTPSAASKSSRPKKGGGGGGGGGGRGRGGSNRNQRRGGGGRGGGSSSSSSNRKGGGGGGGNNAGGGNNNSGSAAPRLSDEEVMIAFLPFMRSGNAAATRLHSEYGSDHRTFITKAREFLESSPPLLTNEDGHDDNTPSPDAKTGVTEIGTGTDIDSGENQDMASAGGSADVQKANVLEIASNGAANATASSASNAVAAPPNVSMSPPPGDGGLPGILSGLSLAGGSSTVPATPFADGTSSQQLRGTGRVNALGPAFASPPPQSMQPPTTSSSSGMFRPAPPGMSGPQKGDINATDTSEVSSVLRPSAPGLPPSSIPSQRIPPSTPPAEGLLDSATADAKHETMAATPAAAKEQQKHEEEKEAPVAATPAKPIWQPRRTHTRLETQAGIVSCNGVQNSPAEPNRHVVIGPRTALQATWSLPLSYLRERTVRRLEEEGMPQEMANELTIRDALSTLTVGLFRRGCAENGEKSSIVSKEIVPDGESDNSSHGGPKDGYAFQVRHDLQPPSVVGKVPFYTPRTPGNVVLRLYFENEPVVTLATGPVVRVKIADAAGLESTLRFVLSNFKAKAGTVNFTSLHNFAMLLEQFRPDEDGGGSAGGRARGGGGRGRGRGSGRMGYDGAGRAAFGCLAESRRVVDCAYEEYIKKKAKLAKEENEINELLLDLDASCEETNENENETKDREKHTDNLNSVKRDIASNEKKWKEMQSAFYSVLKAANQNPASKLILRHEVMSQVKLEIELYCQFCECFAPAPFSTGDTWGIPNFPRSITVQHFEQVRESKAKMQQEVLGFVPRLCSVSSVLHGTHHADSKDPKAVIDQMSTSMIQLYDNKYRVTSDVARMREQCRKDLEAVVGSCPDVFPPGTRVVVFGSCANGFGSPSSDLDMCLQLPPNTALADDEDANGSSAMAKLAEKLKAVGLEDVETARLTARIPVLMFNYPIIASNGDKILLDCDLSMQNPLACLNTSLLLSYASISPQTRVLVSIIKRWAKMRDINSPQYHTLSSYGYIIMLLHFLTQHTTSIDGKIVPYCEDDARRGGQYLTNQPLLPNLQRMQQQWPQSPRGTAYNEMPEKPRSQYCLMPHPTESTFVVNTYFYRVSDQAQKESLKQRFAPTQTGFDPSVAVLLAEFFRYYAYNFDFKKNVVSLNSSFSAGGLVEKEAKAESDGWSLYRHILAIEDPFETFYDVAHVLKPGTFQRVKREFAMAYSKLIDSMTGGPGASWWNKDGINAMSGNDIVDWLCEPMPDDNDGE